jgi:Lipocalin-like domain
VNGQNEFGEKPSGYISYQPDGCMFAMLVEDNRIKPSGAVATEGETYASDERRLV